jgi:hypothetical protein
MSENCGFHVPHLRILLAGESHILYTILIRPKTNVNLSRIILFVSCHGMALSGTPPFILSTRYISWPADCQLSYVIYSFFVSVVWLYISCFSYQNICSHSQWPPNRVVLPHLGHIVGGSTFSSCSWFIAVMKAPDASITYKYLGLSYTLTVWQQPLLKWDKMKREQKFCLSGRQRDRNICQSVLAITHWW